jgi:hypothetical protein
MENAVKINMLTKHFNRLEIGTLLQLRLGGAKSMRRYLGAAIVVLSSFSASSLLADPVTLFSTGTPDGKIATLPASHRGTSRN